MWKRQTIAMPRMIYDEELMSHLDLNRVAEEANKLNRPQRK